MATTEHGNHEPDESTAMRPKLNPDSTHITLDIREEQEDDGDDDEDPEASKPDYTAAEQVIRTRHQMNRMLTLAELVLLEGRDATALERRELRIWPWTLGTWAVAVVCGALGWGAAQLTLLAVFAVLASIDFVFGFKAARRRQQAAANLSRVEEAMQAVHRGF